LKLKKHSYYVTFTYIFDNLSGGLIEVLQKAIILKVIVITSKI
jgi:hypothetical protein